MKKQLFLFCSTLLAIALTTTSNAQQYAFDKKVPLPGDGGYDYLVIDEVNNHLFVSHGTSVNVLDLATEQPIASIDGMQGVHGVAVVNGMNKGFISDGKGDAVFVFDLKTFKTLATIPLSGKDPDAIIYDPYSKKIFAFNGHSKNVSVIDPVALKEIKTIGLGGDPEFPVSDGKGLIYDNIEDLSLIKTIDAKTLTVKGDGYSLAPCGGPTGLALDPGNKRLFTVCRQNKGLSVLDIGSGKVTATLPIGGGVDAVIYDAGRKLVFVSNGDGTATIFKQNSADDYSLVQTLTTTYRAKTMALDKKTHKLYFSAPEFDKTTHKPIPGTFAVLVYKP